MVYNNWNDWTPGFLGNLKASFFEIAKRLVSFVSCSFRINKDRDSIFYFFYGCKDHLKALSDIFSVKEQTIHKDHPDIEKRYLKDFLLGNKACRIWNPWIAQDYIKDASVVTYVEYSLVLRNILFADDSSFHTADKYYNVEGPAYDCQGSPLFKRLVEPRDDPENELYRNGYYQKYSNKCYCKYQTYHI